MSKCIEIKNMQGELKTIFFNTLVLCTGAEYSGGVWRDDPWKGDERRKEIAAAKSVLVVGGGATGVEAAGYLAEFKCNKGVKIGLYHSSSTLVPQIEGAHAVVYPYLK